MIFIRSCRRWPAGLRCRPALGLLVVLLLATAGCSPSEPRSGITTQLNVMVPMRDGVLLAADVYLPAVDRNAPVADGHAATADGHAPAAKWPTILMRTPYGKSAKWPDGEFFASHGYAFVVQDTRGRFASQGTWHMLSDDGRDGADTCDWIAAQSWSDGKVGTAGTSYLGGTQHAMAMERPGPLATAIPVDAMSDMGLQGMRNGGAFELRFWNWIYTLAAPEGSHEAADPAAAAMLADLKAHRRDYLAQLPLRRGTTPLKFAPQYEQWLVAAMGHGVNDEFWKACNVVDCAAQYKDMPVYLVGGWYDSWAASTTDNFVALRGRVKGPVYMIMGPWTHGGQAKGSHGQVSFGKAAAMGDLHVWQMQWYDHWLKGIDNAVGKRPPFAAPVRVFVMGTGDGHKTPAGLLNHGGFWRDEQDWPLARAKSTAFYLQGGGGLAASAPSATAGSTTLRFDPAHPVPTIGGNTSSGTGILLQGAYDQRGGKHVWNAPEPTPLSARNDVLVFQSEPLQHDTEVTGPIVVNLWISSTAVDTDFTAKLLDVYPASGDFPAGFDLNIADGIARTRFRESLAAEKLMQPGTIYPLTIKLNPTANVFKRGHRLRVDISSSNFPRFDVNPNTGEPLNDNRRSQPADNTVYHDAAHPSHIVLPIVARKD